MKNPFKFMTRGEKVTSVAGVGTTIGGVVLVNSVPAGVALTETLTITGTVSGTTMVTTATGWGSALVFGKGLIIAGVAMMTIPVARGFIRGFTQSVISETRLVREDNIGG